MDSVNVLVFPLFFVRLIIEYGPGSSFSSPFPFAYLTTEYGLILSLPFKDREEYRYIGVAMDAMPEYLFLFV